ncbi:MAG: hypothetical protein JWO94_3142 [Verrucomicrobiaceae bacterium]|nr:hypothetical protein [Verrucomicrobiaceae bacterium]
MNASLWSRWIYLIIIGASTIVFAAQPVKTPGMIVRLAFEAANAGHYEEAEKHLTAKALGQINGMMARLAGGHVKLWDGWTKNRTITRIEVLKEEVHDGEATVYYRFYFRDGTSKDDDDSLVVEDGEWKFLP